MHFTCLSTRTSGRVVLAISVVLLTACASNQTIESQLPGGKPILRPTVLPGNSTEVRDLCALRGNALMSATPAKAASEERECSGDEAKRLSERTRSCRAQQKGKPNTTVTENGARNEQDFAANLLKLQQFQEFKAASKPDEFAAFVRTHGQSDALRLVPEARARLSKTCGTGPAADATLAGLRAWYETYQFAGAGQCAQALFTVRTKIERADFAAVGEGDATALLAFVASYESDDPAQLVPQAQTKIQALRDEAAARLRRNEFAAIRDLETALAFVSRFGRGGDPDGLVQQANNRAAAYRLDLYRAEFGAINSIETARAFIKKFTHADPDQKVPQALTKIAVYEHQIYRDAFAAINDEATAQRFIDQYTTNDPDQRIDPARAKLAEYRHQAYLAAFAGIADEAAAQQFIDQYEGKDPDALVPQAQAKLASFRLAPYRVEFAAIDSTASAESFVEKYQGNDPDVLIPQAVKQRDAFRLADQIRDFEALESITQAEEHIARYAGKDAGKTVAKAKIKLVALKKAEARRLAELERAKQQRLAKIRAKINTFVSWREELSVDTNDCVSLFFFKKCLSVTYRFNLRAKIKDFDAAAENYVTEVVDVQLDVPSAVSMKYLEFRGQAVNEAVGKWKGVPMVKPVAGFGL